VLDTSVLVAAFQSARGASRQVLIAALQNRFDLLLSVPLILEYESVLTRPGHLALSGVTSKDVEAVLDDLASVAVPVRVSFRWRPLLPDANDDMVLETAVNGNARGIATFDRRHFASVTRAFAIEVISPADVLNRLRRM
jgi:putative PIN family toxin of toxin-antitoxin system